MTIWCVCARARDQLESLKVALTPSRCVCFVLSISLATQSLVSIHFEIVKLETRSRTKRVMRYTVRHSIPLTYRCSPESLFSMVSGYLGGINLNTQQNVNKFIETDTLWRKKIRLKISKFHSKNQTLKATTNDAFFLSIQNWKARLWLRTQ